MRYVVYFCGLFDWVYCAFVGYYACLFIYYSLTLWMRWFIVCDGLLFVLLLCLFCITVALLLTVYLLVIVWFIICVMVEVCGWRLWCFGDRVLDFSGVWCNFIDLGFGVWMMLGFWTFACLLDFVNVGCASLLFWVSFMFCFVVFVLICCFLSFYWLFMRCVFVCLRDLVLCVVLTCVLRIYCFNLRSFELEVSYLGFLFVVGFLGVVYVCVWC